MASLIVHEKRRRRLLFDLTGLLQWYGFFAHPSGIQRVTEQLASSEPVNAYRDLTFVARARGSSTFFEIGRDIALGLCEPGTRSRAIARARGIVVQSTRLSGARGQLSDLRYFDLPYVVAGYARLESLVEALHVRGFPRRLPPLAALASVSEDDVFFNPGDYWCHRTYVDAVRDLKRSTGLRTVVLIHDLFASQSPGWMNPASGPLMADQLERLSLCVDRWLATSHYVERSLGDYLASRPAGGKLSGVLPLGRERIGLPGGMDLPARRAILAGLGLRDPYILCVGTVEPRKNVLRLLDALSELRADPTLAVPHCVLVGRDGWHSEDVRRRLRVTAFEQGRVSWLRQVSDIELGALYDGAIFSVVPSHAEGWGLPITESLAHGLPCIATSGGGAIEAGAGMALHFDAADPHGLRDALRSWIGSPQALDRARAAARSAQQTGPSGNDAGAALIDALFR